MKTEYLPSFIKDLKALKSSPIYGTVCKLCFEELPQYSAITEIRNLKKLKSFDNAYRIRVGNYRIGFFLIDETVTFTRVLHRSKIYRYFP